MSVKDMMSNWVRNNNSRLVKKQTSIRLPVHAAAKIEALCEMYPSKTRNEIITDLLTAALDDAYDSFAFSRGDEICIDGEPHYTDCGARKEYTELANKHFIKLEKELGNNDPKHLFDKPLTHSVQNYEAACDAGYQP